MPKNPFFNVVYHSLLVTMMSLLPVSAATERPPNVLFISVDDLNDWVGCLGGNKQSITPNIDRLATSGMLFTNAHCVAASCNPSRTATMAGLSPHKSGVYHNGQKMREVLPKETILPKHFSDHGYWSGGSGKMLHYFIDAPSWIDYFPDKESENPLPRTLYPENRPVSLPRAGPWQYIETDWAKLDASDEEFGGDYLVSQWVSDQLSKTHEKPFFLACGFYRPHEPWFVPEKYFKPFPLEDIQLPAGYKEDDLEDLPESGKRRGPNRYFSHIQKHGQWKQGVQGYLASIHFADAMLGNVLTALENGPNKDNTIVVLWSDHGWHLGEKQHWQKFTAWRACTRVPLIVKVPKGISTALPDGVKAGSICDQPVSLISLFPTLTDLCGIPAKTGAHGNSILKLLKDPMDQVDRVAITYLGDVGTYGMSGKDWRYIHYANGDEELYDIKKDPYEWENLAMNPKFASKLAEFRNDAPSDFAPLREPSAKLLPALSWVPYVRGDLPPSKPDGRKMRLVFMNQKKTAVVLNWVSEKEEMKLMGEIAPGQEKTVKGKPGTIWAITDPKADPKGKVLGYFRVLDRASKAVIK